MSTSTLANMHKRIEVASAIPRYVQSLKTTAMRTLDSRNLVKRRDTGTLQASERPFENEPNAPVLDVEPGHSVPGASERNAVLEAAKPWGTVGYANNAQSAAGYPYGLLIDREDGHLHRTAHEALPSILAASSPAAWERARKGKR